MRDRRRPDRDRSGHPISRRQFVQGGAALGATLGASLALSPDLAWALDKATHAPLHRPGSLPDPHRPAGTHSLPQIEHVIVLMMENHSYDNYLGLLERADGFTLDRQHHPTATNPNPTGDLVHAYPMANACQLDGAPSQSWNNSHISWDNGRNDGFVRASGPVAMGYFSSEQIPFYYSLAKTFPVCDRWFCSLLGQTYPNRRFLMAGTAYGIVSTDVKYLLAPSPPNGTIFDQLNAHGISWGDYYSDLPQVGLFKSVYTDNQDKIHPVAQYFTDAAAGTLPAVTYIDPEFDETSEEDPQDIQRGEAFSAQVIHAAMEGPGWDKTVLVWLYDEHGGYYDHVPPPRAVKPDNIPPDIQVPPFEPGAYNRYGFRVPAAIVSPYAKRDYVSHVVHDHTSVLKLIETVWNLPALTYRDANADNLLDALDLHGRPPFREPPPLAEPGAVSRLSECLPGQPGPIPPPGAVTPAPPPKATAH